MLVAQKMISSINYLACKVSKAAMMPAKKQKILAMPGKVRKFRKGVIALLVVCFLLGCTSTTKPLVWKAKDFTFSNSMAFEILPVLNATGRNIEPEALYFLTVHLNEQFRVNNLQPNDLPHTKSEVLTVQSEILVFKINLFASPAPPQKNMTAVCILRTRLFQKSSVDPVAEIVTVNEIDVGQGLFEPKSPEYVLKKSAAAAAKEVARMM